MEAFKEHLLRFQEVLRKRWARLKADPAEFSARRISVAAANFLRKECPWIQFCRCQGRVLLNGSGAVDHEWLEVIKPAEGILDLSIGYQLLLSGKISAEQLPMFLPVWIDKGASHSALVYHPARGKRYVGVWQPSVSMYRWHHVRRRPRAAKVIRIHDYRHLGTSR